MTDWISVKSKLPETRLEVLVAIKDITDEGEPALTVGDYFPGYGWSTDWSPTTDPPDVTHWMPLPDPPQTEAHDEEH